MRASIGSIAIYPFGVRQCRCFVRRTAINYHAASSRCVPNWLLLLLLLRGGWQWDELPARHCY